MIMIIKTIAIIVMIIKKKKKCNSDDNDNDTYLGTDNSNNEEYTD